ncbi:MAG: hypothetical protein ACLFR1_07525 [Spirochaetia bacterium]
MKRNTFFLLFIGLIQILAASGQSWNYIDIGSQVNAELSESDESLESGEYYDEYSLEASRGDLLIIQIYSDYIDPYMILETPDGETIDIDDSFGSTNPFYIVSAASTGIYNLVATSYSPGETGDYTVEVTDISNANRIEIPPSGFIDSGRLDESDFRLPDGRFADISILPVEQAMEYDISLSSNHLDTVLSVTMPGGTSYENDDFQQQGGRPTDSFLSLTAPAQGNAVILSTSYSASSGLYYIEISEPRLSPAAGRFFGILQSPSQEHSFGEALLESGLSAGPDIIIAENNSRGLISAVEALSSTATRSDNIVIAVNNRYESGRIGNTQIRDLELALSDFPGRVLFFFDGPNMQTAAQELAQRRNDLYSVIFSDISNSNYEHTYGYMAQTFSEALSADHDRNNDGYISFREFIGGMNASFYSLDWDTFQGRQALRVDSAGLTTEDFLFPVVD